MLTCIVYDKIESLAFDLDYRAKFTRAEFETESRDLKHRFAVPIQEALARSGRKLVSMLDLCGTARAHEVIGRHHVGHHDRRRFAHADDPGRREGSRRREQVGVQRQC